MTDSNAPVGALPSTMVGTFGAESETPGTEPFLGVLESNQLYLPATFEMCAK